MAEFIGTHIHTMDDKGRVSVPAHFRRMLTGEDLYLNRELDNCLVLYQAEKWEQIKAGFEEKLSRSNRQHRRFLRWVGAKLRPVTVDSQGRIAIPQDMQDAAGITGEVMFLGQFDRIELWDPQKYEAYMRTEEESFEDIAETLDIDL
ncbi:MAG: division/cell wall cluster transcriptional repressor MraZ [Candidatus Fermentibacteraceae bacterium]